MANKPRSLWADKKGQKRPVYTGTTKGIDLTEQYLKPRKKQPIFSEAEKKEYIPSLPAPTAQTTPPGPSTEEYGESARKLREESEAWAREVGEGLRRKKEGAEEEKKSKEEEEEAPKGAAKPFFAREEKPAPVEGPTSAVKPFFLVASLLHIFYIIYLSQGGTLGTNSVFFFIYAFLGLWAAIGPLKDASKNIFQNLGKNMVISAIAYFWPLIILAAATYLGLPDRVASIIVVFTPIWPLYLMYVHHDPTDVYIRPLLFRFSRMRIETAYVLFWIIVFLIVFAPQYESYAQESGLQVKGIRLDMVAKFVWGVAKNGIEIVLTLPQKVAESVANFLGRQKEIALVGEDAYVSKASQEEGYFGIEIKSVSPVSTNVFPQNSRVDIVANLDYNLSPEIPVSVNIYCTGKDSKNPPQFEQGNVLPLEQSGSSPVSCSFAENSFEPGLRGAKIRLTYDYRTFSPVSTLFVDKVIADKQPELLKKETQIGSALSSGGAVRVDSELSEPIVKIDRSKPEKKTSWKINVNNKPKYAGTIKMKKLVLQVPKGLEITRVSGIPAGNVVKSSCFELEAESALCREDLEDVYTIVDEREIKMVAAYLVWMNTKQKDYDRLLKQIRNEYNLKATLYYTYEFSRETTFEVKKIEGVKVEV